MSVIAHAVALTRVRVTACVPSRARAWSRVVFEALHVHIAISADRLTGYEMNAKDWYLLAVALVYMAAFSSLYTQVPGERGLRVHVVRRWLVCM